MTAAQQLLGTLLTASVGGLMVAAGIAKKRLVWRGTEMCNHCGRPIASCSCRRRRILGHVRGLF